MQQRWSLVCLTGLVWASLATALPTTLLEDVKAAEARLETNKVKRSHPGETINLNAEANAGSPVAYYSNPTATKRASNLKPDNVEEPSIDWDQPQQQQQQQQPVFDERPKAEALAKELFGTDDNPFDDKTLAEYEKGFHYGTNKAKLDEQMENAILKSEMYGDPAAINQYRYYGGSDDRRRKRSNSKRNIRFSNRYKREVELSPEDILTLLSLWEEDRFRQPVGYRTNWPRYNGDVDLDNDRDENDIEETDENWLESPVYPGARNPVHMSQFSHDYSGHPAPYPATGTGGYIEAKSYEPQQQIFATKRQWGGFSDKKRKRFMVSRKRSDPTRELRYLNGPAQGHDDMYSLSQLLGASPQRDLSVPAYHRMVL
ncbi:hypothetical protein CBL_09080 [Carabus blaptoides fortunei]